MKILNLGPDWNKNYVPRISVRRYLNYLGKLERNEPEILIAYFYHLYMGLLSGGQILRKKRSVFNKLSANQTEGNAVTEFSEPIAELKTKIRKLTNKVCGEMDAEMRDKVIKEGQMVFTLNNEIVATIESTNLVVIKRLIYSFCVFGISYLMYRYLRK